MNRHFGNMLPSVYMRINLLINKSHSKIQLQIYKESYCASINTSTTSNQ